MQSIGPAGPMNLREVKHMILEGDRVITLKVGRFMMESIGYSAQRLLSDVAGESFDMRACQLQVEELYTLH